MSIFSTLSRRIQNSFQPQIKRNDPLPKGITKLPGAFINQGNIQNLQVTIKNYNSPASNQSDYENPQYSQVTKVTNDNFERITVIKNMYYEWIMRVILLVRDKPYLEIWHLKLVFPKFIIRHQYCLFNVSFKINIILHVSKTT